MATYTPNLNLKKPASSDAADIADINGNMDLIDAAVAAILGTVYPVGAIYMSVNSTSPATLFGGTWEQIQDTFLLAAGGQYGAGDTGGESMHTLDETELPQVSGSFHIRNVGSSWRTIYGTAGKFTEEAATDTAANLGNASDRNNMQKVTFAFGGGQAHNNMPPYLAVYVWKRTA